MEEQGKAHFLTVIAYEQDLSLPLCKDPFPEQFFRRHDLVRHLLILRKAADKTENDGTVIFSRKPECHVAFSSQSALILPGMAAFRILSYRIPEVKANKTKMFHGTMGPTLSAGSDQSSDTITTFVLRSTICL